MWVAFQRAPQRQHQHLTVVASLVDKATNLGGLCRTCEVFGVGCLVLPSKKLEQDKVVTWRRSCSPQDAYNMGGKL